MLDEERELFKSINLINDMQLKLNNLKTIIENNYVNNKFIFKDTDDYIWDCLIVFDKFMTNYNRVTNENIVEENCPCFSGDKIED